MKQALDLSNDRIEEEVVWASATVNTLVWDQLIYDKDRKNKKLKKAHDRKLKQIAQLIKFWCTGNGRPENGAYPSFNTTYSKRGNVVMPKFV